VNQFDPSQPKPKFNVSPLFEGVVAVTMNIEFSKMLQRLIFEQEFVEPELHAFRNALADPEKARKFREDRRAANVPSTMYVPSGGFQHRNNSNGNSNGGRDSARARDLRDDRSAPPKPTGYVQNDGFDSDIDEEYED